MHDVWLNTDQQLVPGAEVFRTERRLLLEAYSASHSQLLLRGHADRDRTDGSPATTIEVLFKPVTLMKIREDYRGVVIRRASVEETAHIRAAHPGIGFSSSDRVFTLDSQGEIDFVVAAAVGWREDVLGPARMSLFAGDDPERPAWPRHALGPGYDAGLTLASADDLIHALTAA